MQYRPYGSLGFEVSTLGLGCMRLPRQLHADGSAEVDREKAYELIRYAVDHGIRYLDTAFVYHGMTSEEVVGEALEGGYRERVKIATKLHFPAMKTNDDIRRNLECTLKKLRTDYVDCYLLHNVQPTSWPEIKQRNIVEEYVKLKQEGLIRHIGFSYHGGYDTFHDVMMHFPWEMCQIQQNILDVNNEATERAIHLAGERKTALVIMEPLRGGGLSTPPPDVQEIYNSYPIKRSGVEWAFRHLINYPEVSCILSGMTTLEQLKENIEIFSKPDAVPGCISPEERAILNRAKAAYEGISSIPCTGCEYCIPCPQGIKIPLIFKRYNEGIMYDHNFTPAQRWYMIMQRDSSPIDACVACGACERACPQHIDIINKLQMAKEKLDGWAE